MEEREGEGETNRWYGLRLLIIKAKSIFMSEGLSLGKTGYE
jgi:hypothetical protein